MLRLSSITDILELKLGYARILRGEIVDLRQPSRKDRIFMKLWQTTVSIAGGAIALLGTGLAMTNPGPAAYEDFAVHQLTRYLQNNICQELPPQLRQFSEQCRSLGSTLLDTARPQLQNLIAQNTRRENYLLFSIYRTGFSSPPLPRGYEFETLGVFGQFYIYQMVAEGSGDRTP